MRLSDLTPTLVVCVADQLQCAKHISAFARSSRIAHLSLQHYLPCRFKKDILCLAQYEKNYNLLRRAIQLELDQYQCCSQCWHGTALAWPIHVGDTAMTECLFDAYQYIHRRSADPRTALECIFVNDEVWMMRRLLNRVDMDAGVATKALFIAVSSASLRTVRFLMALNVDLNAKWRGLTPLCMAAICGYTSIQDALLEDLRVDLNCMNPARSEPIIFTLTKNTHYTQADRLTRLLELHERVNLNVLDVQGNTILHFMAEKGHLPGCHFLVQHYPWMLSWANRYGETPLFSAIQYSRADICRYFLNQVDVNLRRRNLDGRTSIQECARSGNLKTFRILFERADRMRMFLPDCCGDAPLLEAAKSGNDEVVAYLIERGVHPDVLDEEGRTPLVLAARHDQITTVKCLLKVKGIKPGKKGLSRLESICSGHVAGDGFRAESSGFAYTLEGIHESLELVA